MMNQNLSFKPIAKAIRVIQSCQTLDQLKSAQRFAELALVASASPAYKMVVELSKDFYLIANEIDSMCEKFAKELT